MTTLLSPRALVRALAAAAALSCSPAAAATITVNAGGDLQAALTRALPGDVIVLQAGATFTGNFTLPAKTASDTRFITIRTSASDAQLPVAGQRMTPAWRSLLPKIKAAGTGSALRTAAGAHHWRLLFLEFVGNTSGSGDIVQLGRGSETVAGNQARDIEVDRVYIHGDPVKGSRRGITLNSVRTNVSNSWISDIKLVGSDSQAICGWNGPGPFRIENNYLSAAGENIMFGGATPYIYGLVPGDIIIRRNQFTKDLSWRSTEPGRWTVKNLLEFKNARRVVVEANWFEYSWAQDQKGYAVMISPVNDGSAPWTVIEDVTIRLNRFDHVAGGIVVSGVDSVRGSMTTSRVRIENNLLTDVSAANWGGTGGFVVASNGVVDLTLNHNTVIHDGFVVAGSGAAMTNFVYTNNLSRHNTYGIYGSGLGAGNVSLAKYFPDALVRRNVLAGGSASKYPADNFFPAVSGFLGLFVSPSTGDYRLKTTSAYVAAGTDGRDIGADIVALNAALR